MREGEERGKEGCGGLGRELGWREWAAGKEKEREREEKGWADWAEKRKGVKERLFHFFERIQTHSI